MSEAFAIASAFCLALSLMLVSELKGRIPVLQLCLWQQLVGLVLTVGISSMLEDWSRVDTQQALLLSASGFCGIVVASTAYVEAIHRAGPRIAALLFSLTAPFALALGYVVLGEEVTLLQASGIVLVLFGVVLAIGVPRRFQRRSVRTPSPKVIAPAVVPVPPIQNPPLSGPLLPGVAFGIVSALGQALGVLFARPAMASGVEPFTAMAVRLAVATVFFVAAVALPRFRGNTKALQFNVLALAASAAFFGIVLGMSLQMAALHDGNVAIVSSLSSITPLLILPMVWVRSGEAPPAQAWLGGILVIAGTALASV